MYQPVYTLGLFTQSNQYRLLYVVILIARNTTLPALHHHGNSWWGNDKHIEAMFMIQVGVYMYMSDWNVLHSLR